MIDYFIISHRQIAPKHTFSYQKILVGENPDTGIDDAIICNSLNINIEKYPYLCSYTGWYAILKNQLYHNNIVSLLEYDIVLSPNFDLSNRHMVEQQSCNRYIIAYSKTLTDHYVFYKSTPWLEISLKKIHNIDLKQFVLSHKYQYPFWPNTTNITMPIEILEAFIDWFHPMTKVFNHDPLGSYVHERALFVFCAIHHINIKYPEHSILQHLQLASHKSIDIYGKFLSSKNSIQLKDSMKPEYDLLYNVALESCINS